MADRTVKVDTILGAGAKEGMEALGLKVKDVDGDVDRLNRSLKQTADDTAKAAATMELLKAASAGAADKVDLFGNKRTVMDDLDTAITRTQGHVRALGDEFNRTGNSSALVNLGKAKADLKDLENLRKDVDNALKTGAEDGGKDASRSFLTAFANGISGILSTPILGPIAIAIVATLVALLIPAVNAALMGLATMGGLATGIIGQLKDPAVQSALHDFGKDFMDTLQQDTASFAKPLIESLHMLGMVAKDVLGSIDFSALSQMLEPLVAGLGSLIENMMPGFNRMLASAGPIMQELEHGLAGLGTAFSNLFDMMAHSGQGGVEGMRLIFMLLIGAVYTLGGMLIGTTKALEYFIDGINNGARGVEWFMNHLKVWADNLSAFGEHIPILGAALETISGIATAVGTAIGWVAQKIREGTDKVREGAPAIAVWHEGVAAGGKAAALTAEQLQGLNTELNKVLVTQNTLEAAMAGKMFSAIMNLDQGVLSWHKSLLDLHDVLDKNGLAIDRHTGFVQMDTRAGLDNREAVLAAMTANMQQYQSFIAAGGAADVATTNYNNNTAALEAMLHKAHYTQDQIDNMIGSLKEVPNETHADIIARGLTEAINNLGNLLAKLNGLDGRDFGFTVTETMTQRQVQMMIQGQAAGGIYTHADVGLLSNATVYSPASPGRYMIAEPKTGGEAFVPRFGEYNRSTGILDQAARWYGGRFMPSWGAGGSSNTVYVTVNAGIGTNGIEVGRQIAEQLRPFVNATGGGNVQAALGRRGQ